MATQSAVNLKITNNADGYDIAGGSTPRKVTYTGADMILTGSGTNVYTFPASTSTLASLALSETFTNKTLTSPLISNNVASAAGSIEYDATCFYSTPLASARGVSPSLMYSIVAAGDFALATTSGVQSAFASTGDVWTLAATTSYFFEGEYFITHTTTTCTTAMAFALGGGASITSIRYFTTSVINAANGAPAAPVSTWVTQVATTVVTATSTVGWAIKFNGVIRMNAGGTVTPQVNFSANTTVPVMQAGSYITFYPIGTNTNNILGNVG